MPLPRAISADRPAPFLRVALLKVVRREADGESLTRSSASALRVILIRLKGRRWIRPAARGAERHLLADVRAGFVRIADGRYLIGAASSSDRSSISVGLVAVANLRSS